MGYNLYITRRNHWFDKGDNDITLDEWLGVVDSDPEMRHDGYAEITSADGQTLGVKSEGLSVWTAYSGHMQGGNMAWFNHEDGSVVVKNPDIEIRQKMYRIAQRLGAKLQGEECETYGRDGQQERGSASEPGTERSRRSPWWKFW